MRQIRNFLSVAVMCIALVLPFGLTLMSCSNDDSPVVDNPDGGQGSYHGGGTGFQVSVDDTFFDLYSSTGWNGHWYDFVNEGEALNFDASAYDYVVINFRENTGKFRFGITYNEWKSTEAWGETFYDTINIIEEEEGISYIRIDKERTYEFGVNKELNPYAGDTWDKHIREVFTQDDGEEVSVKVDGVWFCTEGQLESLLNDDTASGGRENSDAEETQK